MPHHLQTVSYLKHRNSRICRVLDYKFLIILSLETCILRLDGGDLVQTFHHLVNLRRELRRFDIVVRMLSQCLMKENSCNTLSLKTHLVRNDKGDIQRMLYEGMPVIAQIFFQRLLRNLPGFQDQCLPFFPIMWKFFTDNIYINFLHDASEIVYHQS